MKNRVPRAFFRFSIFAVILLNAIQARSQSQISAIYAGGPEIYQGREFSVEELKNSGFNTVILYTLHIEKDGDFGFTDVYPMSDGGKYVGDETFPGFAEIIKELKGPDSSIDRIEMGISAWGSGTYESIKHIHETTGFGPETRIYKNFKALIEAIPGIDAFNNDDEGTYDVESAVAFHTMLYELGVKTAGVPYKNASSYWKPFISQMNAANPGSVDLMYLQVYAGGAGNNPCDSTWQNLGVPIIPGVWGKGPKSGDYNPTEVENKMSSWKNKCNINSGFMWVYNDLLNSPVVKQFGTAINTGLEIVPGAPGELLSRFPKNQEVEISVDEDLSWNVNGFGVKTKVYFGKSEVLTEEDVVVQGSSLSMYDPGTLENGVTYYWKAIQLNDGGQNESEVWSFTTEK